VVLAGQRADVAFELFLGVRNKVVSAYQEIMRMQL
jgi:flagellar hook-basal body complex protein FliE